MFGIFKKKSPQSTPLHLPVWKFELELEDDRGDTPSKVRTLLLRAHITDDKEKVNVGMTSVSIPHGSKTAEILNVKVYSGHESLGYASMMLRWLFANLGQVGVTDVTLKVSPQNERALGLYKRHGGIAVPSKQALHPTIVTFKL